MEEYITNDATFDVNAAVSDERLSEETVAEFVAGYQAGGGEVRGMDSAHQSRIANTADRVQASGEEIDLRSNCAGRNSYRTMPPAVSLDSCNASALSSAMAAGAGVAGIAGVLTAATGIGAVAAGTIGGALAVTSSLTAVCNAWGTGVNIGIRPLPTPRPACSPQ